MTPDTFVTDGVTKTYLTTKRFKTGSTYIFLGGIYQGLGKDYTEDSGNQSITFKNVPSEGYEGEIRYLEYDAVVTDSDEVSSFKEQLVIDFVNTFLRVFAETITYTPKGGAGVLMRAIVDRSQISPAGEALGRVLKDQIRITIANSEIYGMTTIIKAGDKVSLPERIGGANVDFLVTDILGQDEGMWELLLVK